MSFLLPFVVWGLKVYQERCFFIAAERPFHPQGENENRTISVQSGRGGTPPLPHHEACRLLALRGFRSLAPFVQRVLGFSSRRIRFGTLRPYLGTPLRRLLSPSFHGFPLHFSCPSSVRSKSLNGLRIPPFAALWRLLWLLLTSPRPHASLL